MYGPIAEELPLDTPTKLPELEALNFIKQERNVVLYADPRTGKHI